jgi:hypothetical protein
MSQDSKPKKMGRPSSYKPEYCQMLIDHMASGLSFESFGATIGHYRDITFEWAKKYPDFADAKKRGYDASYLFWDKTGLKGVWGGKEFNAAVYCFNMKNRFGWRDQVNVSGDNEKPISISLSYDPKAKLNTEPK